MQFLKFALLLANFFVCLGIREMVNRCLESQKYIIFSLNYINVNIVIENLRIRQEHWFHTSVKALSLIGDISVLVLLISWLKIDKNNH